jgi:hypothetical protein
MLSYTELVAFQSLSYSWFRVKGGESSELDRRVLVAGEGAGFGEQPRTGHISRK